MNEPPIRSFEDLECWQACRKLKIFVARTVVPTLPGDEKFRLVDQILRSARSTTANIAEGYGRYHYLDNAKFCRQSRGSVAETLDHLITASDEGIIPETMLLKGRELVDTANRLINGYIRYLESHRASRTSEEPATYSGNDPHVASAPEPAPLTNNG